MSATNKNRARQLSEVTYIFSNIRLALIHVKCAGDFISSTTWPIRKGDFIDRYWDALFAYIKRSFWTYSTFCETQQN